jgi:gluconolactonase
MKRRMRWIGAALAAMALTGAAPGTLFAAAPEGAPDATVDLGTVEGVRAVSGTWRYQDARVVEVDFPSVGKDLKPSGPLRRTYDLLPHAEKLGYDDAAWEAVDPTTLAARRGNGRVSFAWYRFAFTVPARVGDFDPTGATIAFDIVVDDYAEVWVDGKLERALGQRGGTVVAGWNAPNRVVAGSGVRPGQRIELAIFAVNGPISLSPENYIWVRSARLDFYRPAVERVTLQGRALDVLRKDRALDAVVPPGSRVEKLADGFQFTEGPVWSKEGALLFSDPNTNTIYRWDAIAGSVAVARARSGYEGADVGRLHQPGSNGLAFDSEGRLTICEHGNRRVTRIEHDGKVTILADRYEGKKLNSPNDLVYRSDGALYFTDPPFGLPAVFDDPAKELSWSGVFRLRAGKLEALDRTLTGPNGIALSPDERFLYVGNWDEQKKVVMRYELGADGTVSPGVLFADLGVAPGADAIDGVKVDRAGDVFVSGPDGVWVLSPAGRHLGTIRAPRHVHNMAWGGADRKTLYLCARDALYRMPLQVAGFVPTASAGR